MHNDITLIDAYLAGDEHALEELVKRHQRKIYSLAFRMTGHVEDSKDITQRAFMQAFTRLEAFRREASFYTWLYRIAVNITLNHLGSEKKHRNVELHDSIKSNGPSPSAQAVRNDLMAHVRGGLAHLPKQQRLAVVLRSCEGKSLKETAAIMGCSEGAVKAHCHIGIKRLKQVLREKGHEIEA